MNQIRVDDRTIATPAELIAELREVGPRAIATRKRLPAIVRAVRLPLPLLGVAPIGYVTDLLSTRVMWIHRLDNCPATSREMGQTRRHHGATTTLLVPDRARKLPPEFAAHAGAFGLMAS